MIAEDSYPQLPKGFSALSLGKLCLEKEMSAAKALSFPSKGGHGGREVWRTSFSPPCSALPNFPEKNNFLMARNIDMELLKE